VDFVEIIFADATTVGHNRRFDNLRDERHMEIRQFRELARISAVFWKDMLLVPKQTYLSFWVLYLETSCRVLGHLKPETPQESWRSCNAYWLKRPIGTESTTMVVKSTVCL